MAIRIVSSDEVRELGEDALPLSITRDGELLDATSAAPAEPIARLDVAPRADGTPGFFVQPGDDARVLLHGRAITETTWLDDGDVLDVGGTELRVRRHADAWELSSGATVTDEPDGLVLVDESDDPIVIEATELTLRPLPQRTRTRRRPGVAAVLAGVVLLGLGLALAFLFLARTVTVEVLPSPDRLAVEGNPLRLELDGRRLLWPGSYRVQASAAGHHDLDVPIEVDGRRQQVFRFEMEPLPGLVHVVFEPEPGEVPMSVQVDEDENRPFDGTPLELTAGEHALLFLVEGHLPARTTVLVRGRGEEQEHRVTLVPDAARLSVASEPSGARVRIDGTPLGRTPLSVGLASGRHRLAVSKSGYLTEERTITIEPGRDVDLGVIALARAPGQLTVKTTPTGARVNVDGADRGTAPMTLELPSNRELSVRAELPGHAPVSRRLRLAPGEQRALELTLSPTLGTLTFDVAPADAELLVDGVSRGRVPASMDLPTVTHRIELRAPGHQPWSTTLTPSTDRPRLVSVSLDSLATIQARRTPPKVKTASLGDMVLVAPGEFRMGASRREPGRRSNEVLRQVRLTRPFYLATTEVTNALYSQFDPSHRSGSLRGHPLDADDQPVVRVSWDAAARFCNWMSQREGLPFAYVESGGEMVPVTPTTTGYRLPTEAEWEWAARHADGGPARRYSWGDRLPVPAGAANLGDSTAAQLLPRVLDTFTDGHLVTAPVGSFAADRRGLHDLSGNVAEWVQDVYGIPTAGSGAVTDPLGPGSGESHAIKGSSWMHATVSQLRLSYRDHGQDGRPDLGFRLARSPEPGGSS
ncbi:MAG: SUMF1/EgtB/PvdO family nonheme iron enzyme [Acidobacteriota bacterium]